ncbi:oligosaccharide flippase family protein [Marinobacter daepoensis]|uniref:lipopolysaccharide biosynthesis protein n=1 Tax=Marinobacter daepoensis TaxID=262077 RepID=UPI001C956532|nr:oligosaccharide flippase family protein [Marinobacter daepoensis]MBY6033618.1 oligosaccharide flippase family protein [Marinobacter daepoensis]
MKLIKSASIYIFASVLNKAVPFLLLPVFTKFLSPEEFGSLSLFLVANSCVIAFIGMNVSANVTKNFFFLTKEELAVQIGDIFLLILGLTLFVFFLALFVFLIFPTAITIDPFAILIMPFLSFFMMVNTVNLTILRNENRPIMFGIFEIATTVLTMAVTLFLLIVVNYGWLSQVFGLLVAYGFFFFIAIGYMSKRGFLLFRPTKQGVSGIFWLSFPMVPYVLSGIAINAGDRILIERILGLDALGIYTVAYSFGLVVMLFSDAFNKAWSPWFYKKMANPVPSEKAMVVNVTYLYCLLIFCFAVLVSFVGKVVLPLAVDKRFHAAGDLIFWVALAYCVQGVYKMFFPYFILVKKTRQVSVVLMISAAVGLVAGFVFIRSFGLIGAPWSVSVAWATALFLAVRFQMKNIVMPWGRRVETGF